MFWRFLLCRSFATHTYPVQDSNAVSNSNEFSAGEHSRLPYTQVKSATAKPLRKQITMITIQQIESIHTRSLHISVYSCVALSLGLLWWRAGKCKSQRTLITDYWMRGRGLEREHTPEFLLHSATCGLSKSTTISCCIKHCSPLKVNRRFGGTYRLHLQGRISRARY
jgi:hypothetical protein